MLYAIAMGQIINSFAIVAVVKKVECCFDKIERCFDIVAGVDGALLRCRSVRQIGLHTALTTDGHVDETAEN